MCNLSRCVSEVESPLALRRFVSWISIELCLLESYRIFACVTHFNMRSCAAWLALGWHHLSDQYGNHNLVSIFVMQQHVVQSQVLEISAFATAHLLKIIQSFNCFPHIFRPRIMDSSHFCSTSSDLPESQYVPLCPHVYRCTQ